MLKPELSNRFKQDYKLLIRRAYDITKLDAVVLLLLNQVPLKTPHQDHPLKGKWRGYRNCHVANDWVLVYKLNKDVLTLILSETGTHSDILE